ncbi:MAG TPA: protoporphyrinogen oxidase [Verrucomicrobiales bacterium]|nr:protoporphyrinogen oxidase [Verrucomicrobiae bacterium]RZO72851.1 MAG: protoporphyrinogen oxidase [Limisphaerales bacterium]HAO66391.1 protoporphyrinogen oxidase [Verrucomicrobiales bacterium]HAQ98890.1 protoporphyrinogen oxidase [Verrucomicrobiales bacterium]HCP37252.1 protoporphyrinogen oxidase [Verrucomicrobiales bacterium]|tara:strand:+ start:17678 stop:19045 length:1368 start_codon:yes stop_codon:yes gene_type:complete
MGNPNKTIAILGGGITGLTAAYELLKLGHKPTVFESSPRIGGAIETIRQNDFLAECGPNTLLETSPRISNLISDLGLDSRKRYANPSMKNRYIIKGGKPVPMPLSPGQFVTTKLFSLGAKLNLIKEPFIAPCPSETEESLAAFIVRRLGQEFLDYAINPFVAGVYAGDPSRLSVQHAFPKLYALEQKYGSMIKGQFFGARERKIRGTVSKDKAKLVSFDQGLEVLVDGLGQKIGDTINISTVIESVEKDEKKWIVQGRKIREKFDAVITAIPTHRMTNMTFRDESDLDLSILRDIIYPPVTSVVMGFRRDQIRHSLEGFGMLVPKVERKNILGTIFSSSLFENRAPEGYVTLSTYIGGMRQPDHALLGDQEMDRLILKDLEALLGVRGEPAFINRRVWKKAIPQYTVGYGKILDRFNELEAAHSGLFFAGHYRNGISLGDSILAGLDVTHRINQQ